MTHPGRLEAKTELCDDIELFRTSRTLRKRASHMRCDELIGARNVTRASRHVDTAGWWTENGAPQGVSNVAVAANGTVTVTRNIVRDANPAGQIWVIDALKANVATDGRIRVRGRGLLLGGGNNIGFSVAASVFATLYCGPATAFTAHSTDKVVGVTLEPNGDFRIDDVLNPTPPADCANPILLIRNLAGSWFAAGIQKLDDNDD